MVGFSRCLDLIVLFNLRYFWLLLSHTSLLLLWLFSLLYHRFHRKIVIIRLFWRLFQHYGRSALLFDSYPILMFSICFLYIDAQSSFYHGLSSFWRPVIYSPLFVLWRCILPRSWSLAEHLFTDKAKRRHLKMLYGRCRSLGLA
jgi:hypothetical protein